MIPNTPPSSIVNRLRSVLFAELESQRFLCERIAGGLGVIIIIIILMMDPKYLGFCFLLIYVSG